MSSNILELVYDAIMERRRPRPLVIILSVIGAIAAAALIAYGVYRFMTPDYFDDYDDDDDFDDDFEDDFDDDFEDEEAAAEA